MIPRFTHENFRQALLYLLPMGPIWSREPGSLCHYWASIIGQVYVRNSDRAIELLQVSFPGTATELLDEWEKTVGLPDPCVGEVTDLQLRQRLVVDRLVSSVDSNINFYIMYAKNISVLTSPLINSRHSDLEHPSTGHWVVRTGPIHGE